MKPSGFYVDPETQLKCKCKGKKKALFTKGLFKFSIGISFFS